MTAQYALPDLEHRLSFPGLEGLYGWVTVDGKPAEVYGMETQTSKMVAYIEAKDGQQFQAHFVDQRSAQRVDNDYRMWLCVDGEKIAGMTITCKEPFFLHSVTHPGRHQVLQHKRVSQTSVVPLLFSSIRLTDNDDEACNDEQVVKNVGNIQLKLWRTSNVRYTPLGHNYTAPQAARSFHEQAKKASALSHQATFGSEEEKTASRQVKSDLIDPRDTPYSTIEFRYRSHRILQLEGLIPVSPSPSPRASSSPPLQLNPPPAAPAAGPSRPRPNPSKPATPGLQGAGLNITAAAMADDELQAELESLKRQERIAQLEREARRRSAAGVGAGGSSQNIKAEPNDGDERARKRVKLEEVDKVEKEKEESRKKGKRPLVIDLCVDSD